MTRKQGFAEATTPDGGVTVKAWEFPDDGEVDLEVYDGVDFVCAITVSMVTGDIKSHSAREQIQ